MVDLTPLDRLTRKRNSLLQKQLEFRLQIIQEEYRMTKKELEKSSKDIGDFLMCLHHTAPGLTSYGQPDTRAMNAKNILLERRYQKVNNDGTVIADLEDNQKKKRAKEKENDETGGEASKTHLKPPSGGSSRNEFFNRKIVLDSKRRSFLQHALEGDVASIRAKTSEDARRSERPVSHSGFISNRDTQGEISKTRPKSSSLPHRRSKTPRYGRDAYSLQEESLRNHVLGRFDVIFDPQNEKPEGQIRRNIPAATPIVITECADPSQTTGTGAGAGDGGAGGANQNASSNYGFTRRVAWSAPPKRRENPIATVANSNLVNRQTLSVTPRSGTAPNARQQQRPNSMMSTASHASAGPTAAQGLQALHNNIISKMDKRPKTAPPNYELRQRSMAAPRQQVAGILAEIQSRRADTRAMLSKSKQLKQLVKHLAPQDLELDESFSD